MVSALDDGVGKIREKLKEKELLDSTFILFSTDNGGAPSVGGFNYPFKGQKASLYEGGIHSPAFLHVPAGLGASKLNGIYENHIHIVDFFPTLLGMVDRLMESDNNAKSVLSHLGGDIDGVDHTDNLLASLAGNPVGETISVAGNPTTHGRSCRPC